MDAASLAVCLSPGVVLAQTDAAPPPTETAPASRCAALTDDRERLACLQRECAAIGDEARRLACYDALLRAPAGATPQPEQAVPAAPAAPPTKWRRAAVAGEGAPAVEFSLDAEDEVSDWLGRSVRPTLVIECRGGAVAARVRTGAAVQPEPDATRGAELSFDGGPPRAFRLVPEGNEKELRFADAAAAVRELAAHERLTFAFTPFRAQRTAVEFAVAGLGGLLEPVLEPCGLRPPEPAPEPVVDVAQPGPVTPPSLLNGDLRRPRYPERARVNGIEAVVQVALLVRPDGSVNDVSVVSCDRPGFGFEDAALEAVRRWKYRPATQDGAPVEYRLTVPVRFRRN